MKINKVVINNFKNYIGEHVILLKDINIIYGENGTGKSTFFDALEWGLTGTINRYNMLGDDGFNDNDLINFYLQTNDKTEVSVIIEFGEYRLTRSFRVINRIKAGNTTIKIENIKKNKVVATSKSAFEKFMISNYIKFNNNSNAKFTEMIKSAYILSQDQITDFITREKPEERYKSISNIVGLQSNINFKYNLNKIKSEIKSKTRSLLNDRISLCDQIKGKLDIKTNIKEERINSIIKVINNYTQEQPNNVDECKKLIKKINEKLYKLKEKKEISQKLINNLFDNINKVKELEGTNNLNLKKISKEISDIDNNLKETSKSLVFFKKQNHNVEHLNLLKKEIKCREEIIGKNSLYSDLNYLNNKVNEIRNKISQLEYAKYKHEIVKELEEQLIKLPVKIQENISTFNEIKEKNRTLQQHILNISNDIIGYQDSIMFELSKSIENVLKYVELYNTNGYCPVCSSYVGDNLKCKIQEQKAENDDVYIKNKGYLEKMHFEKLKLEDLFKVNKDMLSEIEEQNKMLINKMKDSKGQLVEIESDSLYNKLYFQLEYKSINEQIELLNKELRELNNVLKVSIELKQLKEENNNLLEIINININNENLNEEINLVSLKLKELQEMREIKLKKKEDLEQNLNKYKAMMSDFYKLGYEDETEIRIIYENIEKEENNINSTIISLEELQGIYFRIEENERIDCKINDLRIKLKDINERVSKINLMIESIDEISQVSSDFFGGHIKDYLNRGDANIQRYFKYLNPIPWMDELVFEGDDEKLYINVKCNGEKCVPAIRSMSSGQLNVLAIAIFLAVNHSQKLNDLEFIAIDDPIQNMDDVNQFSICDILGGMEKQLIFSTHDLSFVKLFLKKNEYKTGNIQILNLKGYCLNKEKVKIFEM